METDTTIAGLPPETIKEYHLITGDNNDHTKLISKLRMKICLTQNRKIFITELILSVLIFVIMLTWVSFKIRYQLTFISDSDVPENATVGKAFSPFMAKATKSHKLEKIDTSTNNYDNDVENNTLSNIHFHRASTTADAFLAVLTTSTKSKISNQPSIEYAFQSREKEHVNNSVCEHFQLTSNGPFLHYMPELLGEYRHEPMKKIGNETHKRVIQEHYVNDDTGFILVQSFWYLDKHRNPKLAQNLTNLWSIMDSVSNRVLAFNGYCNCVTFPISNVCQHGWSVNVDDLTWGRKENPWMLDISASVLCTTPHHTVPILPSGSICKEFELRPHKTFVEPVLRQFIDKYEYSYFWYNKRVVYKGINSSNALFSVTNNDGKNIWMFANENLMNITTNEDFHRTLKSHDIQGSVATHFCPNVELPANGECTYDWYYMTLPNETLHLNIRGTVHCTKYSLIKNL